MPNFSYTESRYENPQDRHYGQPVFRPFLGTMLERDGRFSTKIWSLVDSGGDYCMFPLTFLDELGIDRSTLKTSRPFGMGEGFPAYFATVTVHVMGLDSFEEEVAFCERVRAEDFAILGNRGFFDRFRIAFDHRNRIFSVNP